LLCTILQQSNSYTKMSKPLFTFPGRLVASLILLIIAFVIHSCRKNTTADQQINPDVISAKTWYEKTYPGSQNNRLQNMATAGETTNGDFSKIIKPDWNKSLTYTRLGSHVIELPLDTAVKLGFTPEKVAGSYDINKNASKNSFLIIGDAANYNAYLMTIVADSSYLNGNFGKLANLSYRHIDKDFSGSVMYFKPTGGLVNGYQYLNGKIIKTISPQVAAASQQVQSKVKANAVAYYECNTYRYQVYLGVSCNVAANYDANCTFYYKM